MASALPSGVPLGDAPRWRVPWKLLGVDSFSEIHLLVLLSTQTLRFKAPIEGAIGIIPEDSHRQTAQDLEGAFRHRIAHEIQSLMASQVRPWGDPSVWQDSSLNTITRDPKRSKEKGWGERGAFATTPELDSVDRSRQRAARST